MAACAFSEQAFALIPHVNLNEQQLLPLCGVRLQVQQIETWSGVDEAEVTRVMALAEAVGDQTTLLKKVGTIRAMIGMRYGLPLNLILI